MPSITHDRYSAVQRQLTEIKEQLDQITSVIEDDRMQNWTLANAASVLRAKVRRASAARGNIEFALREGGPL
jgi:hypothetical protein